MTGTSDKILGIIPVDKATKVGTYSTTCRKLAVIVNNNDLVFVELEDFPAFYRNFSSFSDNHLILV